MSEKINKVNRSSTLACMISLTCTLVSGLMLVHYIIVGEGVSISMSVVFVVSAVATHICTVALLMEAIIFIKSNY